QGAKPPHEFVALSHLLHDLRLYKSRAEIRLMHKSAQIAAEAHVRAMRAARPGMNEHEVEAELLHTFRKHGAVPSYEPIVGGGANGCVLHYRANNATLRDGDLLLIDAGAEFSCYASDITRTFPVNGRYTPEQRALYDIVLAAQLAAIDEVRPGRSFDAYHQAAVRSLTAGLIKLGLLSGSLRSNLDEHRYRRFYMHKTGHWLGLDVHDVGDYRVDGEYRELEPGMVVTVEPGLYISPDMKGVPARFRGIGIRIEDDVVVTRGDPSVLSSGVPKDADEIEALMASA
ncbi:MAG TPA: M24B family metallopeptidase, partial [Dokdonella sp.]|nr:M24B family metallopeptidase [Dokdonella sp.]